MSEFQQEEARECEAFSEKWGWILWGQQEVGLDCEMISRKLVKSVGGGSA